MATAAELSMISFSFSSSSDFTPMPSLASRNAFRRLKRFSMSSPDGVAGFGGRGLEVVRGGLRTSPTMSSRGVRCLLFDAVLLSLLVVEALLRIPLGRPDRRLATRRRCCSVVQLMSRSWSSCLRPALVRPRSPHASRSSGTLRVSICDRVGIQGNQAGTVDDGDDDGDDDEVSAAASLLLLLLLVAAFHRRDSATCRRTGLAAAGASSAATMPISISSPS
mmetsp:Transcript_16948/g.40177  ORF Transcript_16948/g.40177 Transcript_16948/m.40177 type:complete len:221 (-) Transcript_16948:699-1361(-)